MKSGRISKTLSFILIFSLLFSTFSITESISLFTISTNAAENTTQFAGGDGTKDNPYLISSIEHLENVYKYPSASFRMIADIEGKTYTNSWNPIGTYSKPFSGDFDGNGHTISNLNINETSNTAYACASIFDSVTGSIRNLTLKNCKFTAYDRTTKGSAEDYSLSVSASSLARANSGHISYCTIDATVYAKIYISNDDLYVPDRGSSAGGVVIFNDGVIENCRFDGNVNSLVDVPFRLANSNIAGVQYYSDAYSGGIAVTNKGKITKCSNSGDIDATVNHYSHPIIVKASARCAGIATNNNSDSSIYACADLGTESASTTYYQNGFRKCGSTAKCAGISVYNGGTISSCYKYENLYPETLYPTFYDEIHSEYPITVSGDVENCFYCCDDCVELDTIPTTIFKTSFDFEYGEVTHCLNGYTNDFTEDSPWYQNLYDDHPDDADPYPVLDSTRSRVYTFESCTNYLYTNIRSEEPIDEHIWVTIPATPATCESTGLTEVIKCSKCNLQKKTAAEIPKTEHQYSSEIIKEATCLAYGEMKYTCSVCNDYYYETTDKADHTYSSVKIIKEATCLEAGEKEYACSVCGKSYTEVIKKKDHNIITLSVNYVEATCKSEGSYEEVQYCTGCSGEFGRTTGIIPKLEHIYDRQAVIPPTCTTEGYTAIICSECKDYYKTDFTEPQHSWEADYTIDLQPTCSSTGYKTIHCSECSATQKKIIIPKTDHSFEEWVVVIEPTLTTTGLRSRKCNDCGTVVKEGIPLLKDYFGAKKGSTTVINKTLSYIYGLDIGLTDLEGYLEYSSNMNYETPDGIGTGTKLITFLDGQEQATYTIIIFGDLNSDGVIDVYDASILAATVNGDMIVEENSPVAFAADLNTDTVADIYDLAIINSAVNGETEISQKPSA